MKDINLAYTLGCLSICFQQDKDLATRNLALRLMAAADRTSKSVSDAFSKGRLDTAVLWSKYRSRTAEKKGTRRRRS